MDEQEQKLLKELLQKKLHGTLSKEEEQMLFDLSAKKTGRSPSTPTSSANLATGLSKLNNLITATDSLTNTLEEMAGKVNTHSSQAEAKQTIAEM
ncbi:MAG: hypothetical protein FD167_1205, partial [bacterium]